MRQYRMGHARMDRSIRVALSSRNTRFGGALHERLCRLPKTTPILQTHPPTLKSNNRGQRETLTPYDQHHPPHSIRKMHRPWRHRWRIQLNAAASPSSTCATAAPCPWTQPSHRAALADAACGRRATSRVQTSQRPRNVQMTAEILSPSSRNLRASASALSSPCRDEAFTGGG